MVPDLCGADAGAGPVLLRLGLPPGDHPGRLPPPPVRAPARLRRGPRLRRVKYYLLFVLLGGALFSLNLVGLFDPLSLLYRSLALVFYPAFGYGVEKSSLTLYRWGQPFTYVSEPAYQFFKATILPLKPLVYLLPFLTLAICPGGGRGEGGPALLVPGPVPPGGAVWPCRPLFPLEKAAHGPLPRLRRLCRGLQNGGLRRRETRPAIRPRSASSA